MIIFDLDGCLADCEHRRHFVSPPKKTKYIYTDSIPHKNGCILTGEYRYPDGKIWKPDWKSFYEACDKDKPITPVIETMKRHALHGNVQVWSGRCESVREKTLDWFNEHIPCSRRWFDENLKMRPIGDYTPDDELKERWLDEYIHNAQIEAASEAITESGISFINPIEMVFDDRPKVIRMWQRRGIFVFNCCQHNNEF